MAPATHLLIGWLTAETIPSLPRRDRFWIALAGVLPDADGAGLVAGLLCGSWDLATHWFTVYHHAVGHNLLAALVVTGAIGWWCRSWRTAALAAVAFHLHLLCDLAGSRGPDGYQWPIPYLTPLGAGAWTWDGQWALNAWPNTVITAVCLVTTLVLALRRGRWITELLSVRWDAAVVEVLRRRLGWLAPKDETTR